MIKRALLFFLLLQPWPALAEHNAGMEMVYHGYRPGAGYNWSFGTSALNTVDGGDADDCSDQLIAFSIEPHRECTVSSFTVYLSAVNGALAAADLSLEVQGESSGVPDNTAVNTYTSPTGTIAAANFITFTGMNDTITAGSRRYFVVKNCATSETTVYPTIARDSESTRLADALASSGTGSGFLTSSNGGTAWTSSTSTAVPLHFVTCEDGASDWGFGHPAGAIWSGQNGAATALDYRVYSTRKAGAVFTSDPNGSFCYQGITCAIGKNGTPDSPMFYELRNSDGSSVIASTSTLAVANSAGLSNVTRYFTSAQCLATNTQYIINLAQTSSGGASGSSWGLSTVGWHSDSLALALRPFSGTFRATRYDGSSWTATDSLVPACALIPDSSSPLDAPAGTGGKKSTFNRGFN